VCAKKDAHIISNNIELINISFELVLDTLYKKGSSKYFHANKNATIRNIADNIVCMSNTDIFVD